MSLLTDHAWKPRYDSGEDDLIAAFYVPALMAAVRYDRTTGYFSAGVLTLASRGLEGLIRASGRMRLIVGCTLDEPEVEAIRKGESLRDAVGAHLKAMPLDPTSVTESAALELLAWMIERGHLEVRVGIPCDAKRQPRGGTAIFHDKVGVLEDKVGDRIAFSGSLNETPSGWRDNHESFHVFTTWRGGEEHVKAEEASFQRLWNDQVRHCRVVDVPTAVREDLLRFLPKDGALPRRLQESEADEPLTLGEPQAPLPLDGHQVVEPPAPLSPVDARSQLWEFLGEAPKREPGGERVGEATSAVEPWPHQVHTFERMYRAWPPRLLIADEVGLGKTIEAGLLIRQAWLAGRVRRVLVLAPKAVLGQWQAELREKFNLNWPIYDGQMLCWYTSPALRETPDRDVARDAWHKEPFVIASSQLMRRHDRADELCQRAEPYDLIVVDEAHHARRKGAGGTKVGSPNRMLTVLQALCARTQALLLLTATPMQVAPIEVLDLISLLGTPPAWTLDAFARYFEKAAHRRRHLRRDQALLGADLPAEICVARGEAVASPVERSEATCGGGDSWGGGPVALHGRRCARPAAAATFRRDRDADRCRRPAAPHDAPDPSRTGRRCRRRWPDSRSLEARPRRPAIPRPRGARPPRRPGRASVERPGRGVVPG